MLTARMRLSRSQVMRSVSCDRSECWKHGKASAPPRDGLFSRVSPKVNCCRTFKTTSPDDRSTGTQETSCRARAGFDITTVAAPSITYPASSVHNCHHTVNPLDIVSGVLRFRLRQARMTVAAMSHSASCEVTNGNVMKQVGPVPWLCARVL